MLLYLKGITNKDLRYSSGNSAQLLCASLDERGVWGRMDTHTHTHTNTHIYIWLSPFAVHLKLSQY